MRLSRLVAMPSSIFLVVLPIYVSKRIFEMRSEKGNGEKLRDVMLVSERRRGRVMHFCVSYSRRIVSC